MQIVSHLRVVMVIVLLATAWNADPALATRPLVIATSPAVKDPIAALGNAFEAAHPDVRVQLAIDMSVNLRRTIAGMENREGAFMGSGPIHLVAPGGDELLTRLEQKFYVLPDTKVLYATEQLVLVAPESLTDAPESFEELRKVDQLRIAVADRTTRLGVETDRMLSTLRLKGRRLDMTSDHEGILDHLLSGEADVGIMFGHQAARFQDRIRILAVAPVDLYQPVPHSVAMERYCPDRALCEEFLRFVTSPEAQAHLKRLGYGAGKAPKNPIRVPMP